LRETLEEAGWLPGMLATRGPFAENLFVRAVPADTARSPVPFACRADGRSGRVQRNGAFEIDGIAPGVLYELRAGAVNQPFEDESFWNPPMFAASSDEEVRVPWEADATVTFALVDATERSPVTTCAVELEGVLPKDEYFRLTRDEKTKNIPNQLLKSFANIPAQKYAVFSHREHVSKMYQTLDAIDKWFPGSGLEVASETAQAPTFFERYSEEFDPRTGMGGMEVWVPIKA
jgi:hypothetical protein